MGSQTLEILRQGVWASLTGGWFYDPHQNVFCNAVHLYLWLFLLCTPFITYLYFPKTFATWGAYCLGTTLTIGVLKIINMALHMLYDKAQALSESNLKNPFKGSKEDGGEEDCGIEMQVLNADIISRSSEDHVINETCEANSIISMDNVNSTIDLKVDVHRKNSSESCDSISYYPSCIFSNISRTDSVIQTGTSVECGIVAGPSNRYALQMQSKSEENTKYCTEFIEEHENKPHPKLERKFDHVRKRRVRSAGLGRQGSLDSAADPKVRINKLVTTPCDRIRDVQNVSGGKLDISYHKTPGLLRYSSTETHEERQKLNQNLFLPIHHEHQSINDCINENGRRDSLRGNLQSWMLGSSDMYLEVDSYTKSDMGIEKIDKTLPNSSKNYHLHQHTPMRKDSNSTMSALHLPVLYNAPSAKQKKRRHSNTASVSKSFLNSCSTSAAQNNSNSHVTNVRRIKSAALEISCPQTSVSNLKPHPNSVEAISGKQIKNCQSAMLPPPSKCLVRNPHLNLCPKFGSASSGFGNSNNAITETSIEPVYPIVEQADERSLSDMFVESSSCGIHFENFDFDHNDIIDNVEQNVENDNVEIDVDDHNDNGIIDVDINEDDEADGARAVIPLQQQRLSTTESESEIDRVRTHSTDSETDNNGSRSPLLNKTRHFEKIKSNEYIISNKISQGKAKMPVVDLIKQPCPGVAGGCGDSGCPSSDCDQVSASSKDMLLSKDTNVGKSHIICEMSDSPKILDAEYAGDSNFSNNQTKTVKSLGAIPKVVKRRETSESQDNETVITPQKTHSQSTSPSPSSSRSFSTESFSNDIYKSYKDHWVTYDTTRPTPNSSSNVIQTIPSQNSSDRIQHLNQLIQNMSPYPISHHINEMIFDNSRRNGSESTRASSNNYRMHQKLPTKQRSNCCENHNIDSNKQEELPENNESRNDDITSSSSISIGCITGIHTSSNLPFSAILNGGYSYDTSLMSENLRIRTPCNNNSSGGVGGILNVSGHVEMSDYWRPSATFPEDKPAKIKRFYKYRLNFCCARREIKIGMDRLQLMALFDRDLNWFHVILAIILSSTVCLLGATILQLGFYKDIYAFIFCIVIAGSQYSLVKSVQPDAASPIHGFNKTVAYSRPIYFCLCSGLLILFENIRKDYESVDIENTKHDLEFFGTHFEAVYIFRILSYIMSTLLLIFPLLFSLGLFPQINTFTMYSLEQLDMHLFGGNASISLTGSILCILRSIIAVLILYGPVYCGLQEVKGTQHISFSIFCALLIPLSYHLSRSASDFTHLWTLIKNALVSNYSEEEIGSNKEIKETNVPNNPDALSSKSKLANSTESKITQSPDKSCTDVNTDNLTAQSATNTNTSEILESPDPLPKKLQSTINCRLKNDLVVSTILAFMVLGLHCSTVFTVLQPDLNTVLYSIVAVLGFILHYIIPQLRKHMPWLCFSRPLLKQHEYGQFEVKNEAKIMWFEKMSVYLTFFERNVLFPLVFISALTADSQTIVNKYGLGWGSVIVAICGLKGVRSAYSDPSNQFLILIFSVLLFKIDFNFASETFLIDYFFVSLAFRKCCDFLLKLQFIVTYIAPWQITWGSAFHAFAQPFSVPHSAMLFLQAIISSILSTPLNPFLGSAIFITSYVRPIKFWERDYNTRRIDHSNTRLSSQLERDLGADHNNLNSIFYEHLTRSLQHSLCGDLLLGRWGNVNQGDCFVLASDYINCLVHIIELGNGLCTFQMRGLEFRGTYCQQREVEAISEGVENNEGCCCCSPGHLPKMLGVNAMFSTRWLAWQVVAAKYVVEGYSISENLATATLQLFDFRKVLITYYVKSIIYYVTINPKFEKWIASPSIQEALATTLHRQFVDLDPIFNYNLDEDFDCRALGITRSSFCSIYLNWIQFCYAKQNNDKNTDTIASKTCDNMNKPTEKLTSKILENVDETTATCEETKPKEMPPISIPIVSTKINENSSGVRLKTEKYPKTHSRNSSTSSRSSKFKMDFPNLTKEELINNSNLNNIVHNSSITRDSILVSLCLSLGLLARRSLATASHSSLSGVEFFLHGLHALFKGDFRITSPRDEWVFADMELLHGVVAPAVKMALKLHQDHFSSPDEFLDQSVLYDAITSYSKELVISHEADPVWRSAVLRGAPNLLALRHVLEDGSDEYRIIRLTKRFLDFRVIKLNRECVRGLWSGQQQELIYLRNRNPERGSIQNAKQALRNIINSSCDQPIGYPIYVSPLTTSYADTNKQLNGIIGGAITLEAIKSLVLDWWQRIRNRCREGCSSGSAGAVDPPVELPSVYFSSTPAPNSSVGTTITYGSQNLSCSGTRGSLANINKPTSSTLLAGLLNRERDQEREIIREGRANRKNNASTSRSDRERRATLPITTSVVTGGSRDNILKDSSGSFNSGLRQLDFAEGGSPIISISSSNLSSNLGSNKTTTTTATIKFNRKGSGNMRKLEMQQSSISSPAITSINKVKTDSTMPQPNIDMHRKVIIVDKTEIYDCLDLGRRIDVIWPSEIMRASGGRLSWNDWSPLEGMVGYVVHYWQPNHSDERFRSHVNQTLYLLEIGNHYVPVAENGIKEYNQIIDNSNNSNNASSTAINDISQRSLTKLYVESQTVAPVEREYLPVKNLSDIPLHEINTESSDNSANIENIDENIDET